MLDGSRYPFDDPGYSERENRLPERALTKKNLSESGLKRWCSEGYDDPETGKRIYGKDVLLSAFYGKNGFWVDFLGYAESLTDEARAAIGGSIPTDRASFAYRIKKAGYDRISPKNVCLWLGALDSDSALLCDDAGFLSEAGLIKWCHEGYETPSGKRGSGKRILAAAAESGNFWEGLRSYAERLDLGTIRNMGGNFPYWPVSLAERLKKNGDRNMTIGELFEHFEIPMPEKERQKLSTKGHLSSEGLKKWCSKGYRSPVTGEWIFGSRVLLDALYSGSFWQKFERYANGLSPREIEAVGGRISPNDSGYADRLAGAGYGKATAKNVCLWFGALDESTAALCDDSWYLSAEGLRKWCFEGYESGSGKRVFGKDVLAWCAKTKSFWESLDRYGRSILPEERRRMGGKFPRSAKPLGARTVGKETSIKELFDWFGLAYPPEPTEESSFYGARRPDLPDGLSPIVKGKIRSFVRKVLELGDPEGKNPYGTSAFSVSESEGTVRIGCRSRRILSVLNGYREYVEGTLLYEAAEWSERMVVFDWGS